MCSKSTEKCFKNVPRWLWIIMIIAVIALIIVIAWKINASLKNTYEKKSVEKEERKEKRKDNFKDFEIDFHLRKHAANLKHEKEMTKERQQHELDKLTIALPICLGIVAIICGSVLIVYFKYKLPKMRNGVKSHVPEIDLESNPMPIKSSKMDDFERLMQMGYDPKDVIDAINHSDSIGPALKRLIEKSSYESTKTKSVRDDGKMEYYNGNMNVNKQTNSTTPEKEYVLIGNV